MTWRVLGKVVGLGKPVEIQGVSYTSRNCFETSAQILADIGIEVEQAHTMRDWGMFEILYGDFNKGQEMWEEARRIFQKLGIENEVARMESYPS